MNSLRVVIVRLLWLLAESVWLPAPASRNRRVPCREDYGTGTDCCANGVCGRFLMNVAVEGATAPPITVVLNWDAVLKK